MSAFQKYLSIRITLSQSQVNIDFRQLMQGKKANDNVAAAGIRTPYIRVVGIRVESESRAVNTPVTPEDEEKFRQFAARPDCYEVIARSIAPSIFGSIGMW